MRGDAAGAPTGRGGPARRCALPHCPGGTNPAAGGTSSRAPGLPGRAAAGRDRRAVRLQPPVPVEGRAHGRARPGGRHLASLFKGRSSPRERPLFRAPLGVGQPRHGPRSPPAATAALSAAPHAGQRRSSRHGAPRLRKPPRRRDRPRNFPRGEPRCAAGTGGPTHDSKTKQKPLRPSRKGVSLPTCPVHRRPRAERSPRRPGGVRSALPTGGAPPAAGTSPAGRCREEGATHPPAPPPHLCLGSGTASFSLAPWVGGGAPGPLAPRPPPDRPAPPPPPPSPCGRHATGTLAPLPAAPRRAAHWPARR